MLNLIRVSVHSAQQLKLFMEVSSLYQLQLCTMQALMRDRAKGKDPIVISFMYLAALAHYSHIEMDSQSCTHVGSESVIVHQRYADREH